MRVVIVGAGLGGLSAACHLTGRGHEVVVLERESVPGGRAGLWEVDGYRFDTGPTVMTMNGILSDTFAAAGADMADHLELMPVDPMYRASFPDGSEIRCRHGLEAMHAELLAQCGRKEADSFLKFASWLGEMYRLEASNFIDRNFDSPLDMMKPLAPLFKLVQLGGVRKLSKVVASYFDDPRLQRLFSFQSMYAGLSPFEAMAIYAVITYMDSVEGVFFPVGGMHAIPRAMAQAAEKAGASFVYDTTVTELVRNGRRVTGVRTQTGEVIQADAVVLNPDLPVAYREIVGDMPAPRVATKGRYSPSCAIWLAGVEGKLPDGASHHNIHFGGQWKEAFDALMDYGRPMPDPSILVTSPTHSDPSLAPDGRHILYVLEPTPNLDGNIDWGDERDKLQNRLIERVASYGYNVNAEVERFVDPEDWKKMGMERGTPFALSHHFFQTGPFRPNNVDSRLPGVSFVGSGTLPGVGVPMVLLSGRLAAQRVEGSK